MSTPLRVLIVDDEALARQELEYLLGEEDDVEVVGTGRNGIEAVDKVRSERPDLLFLDVQMPGLDGFGVIRTLMDKRIPLPQVVFATAYDQYAVRAFEVNATDYLLKPFDRARVARTISKARAAATPAALPASSTPDPLDASTVAKLDALLKLVEGGSAAVANPARALPGKIVLRANGRLLLVDPRDVCFATVEEGVITVATSTVEGQSNVRTLEELSDQLDPAQFWRAHRSYLVNIQHIREVVPWFKSSYQLRMDDPKKTEIPVSRNQTRRLRELFNL